MFEKNKEAGKSSPERYRMEHLPGFDAVSCDMQDALERFNDDAQEVVNSFLATLESQPGAPRSALWYVGLGVLRFDCRFSSEK